MSKGTMINEEIAVVFSPLIVFTILGLLGIKI